MRQTPLRLSDYEVFLDLQVPAEGDLVYMVLLTEMEPMSFEEAVKETQLRRITIEDSLHC